MKKHRWCSILAATVLFAGTFSLAGSTLHAQGTSRTFPQTGKTVQGVFLAYWDSHGGLAQQGYPISEELQEKSDTDGKTYTVQYFERAVFELHPENQPPFDVLLSLLGTARYKATYGSGGAPNQHTSTDNPRLFTATGKSIGGAFRQYWETHGELAQQGYPISEEFQEVSPTDGKTYTVQYFERAVFELHSELAAPNNVLLSLLGRFAYNQKHGAGASPTSTVTPADQATTYKNLATSFCLDSNPAKQVYAGGCNGGSFQKWRVQSAGDGTMTLQNLATSYCLDSNPSMQAYTGVCNGGAYQKWRIQNASEGAVTLQNLATSFCLDSNPAGQVYTHGCNGGSYQKWLGQTSNEVARTLQNGTGRCLDSNPALQVYSGGCNGGSFQKWKFTSNSDGTMTLQNLATSYCLDSNPSMQAYTGVCNGGSYQKWRIQNKSGGTMTIQNLATSYCLDGNPAGQVYTHGCNGGIYQDWK